MLIVITGPSGAGKSTLINRALTEIPDLAFSVSHTTRPPRPGEVEGRDYYFVSEDEFSRLVKKKYFVEWAVVHGYRYGTSKPELRKSRSKDLLLDIDVQGAAQIKKIFPQAVFVFVLPPDRATLEERIRKRGDLTEKELERRLERAEKEIRASRHFEYIIVNQDLESAVRELEAIILAARQRREHRRQEIRTILATFRPPRRGR